VGKALLAFAPRSVVIAVEQHLTAYTASTLDTPARLRGALRVVRLTRSATSCGEFTRDDLAVAAPVFGLGGEVVAALELEVQNLHTDLEVARTAVAVAARGLSRELAIDCERWRHGALRSVPPQLRDERSFRDA
jgi:DNA-binding IclR family transcriptional regulator